MGAESTNFIIHQSLTLRRRYVPKNTTQTEATQSELGFSIANHANIEDRFQAYENNLFLKRNFNLNK